MKAPCSNLVRFLFALGLLVSATAVQTPAQTRPLLGLTYSTGQPALNITGTGGSIYSIQYATGLSAANHWADRTLLQIEASGNVWIEPSVSTQSQRFYRAVAVPSPIDTNLVFIQPGVFKMGSAIDELDRWTWEGPQTTVTITRGFWIGKYEVTQGDYLSVVGSNPSYFTAANGYSYDLTLPVEQVSWNDATKYCALRTQQERSAGLIPTNYVYRLPTEAEWEYACRAGTTTRFYYGDDLDYTEIDNYAWYGSETPTGGNSGGMTHTVGQLPSNPWGLYDMIGNVAEWCQDWFASQYPGGSAFDPQGPTTGSSKVFRGGSYGSGPWWSRSAAREYDLPDSKWQGYGFRVVLALSQR